MFFTFSCFFFGGALMERYGIYELIKAFNELCNNYKDIDLYICGHHADNKKLQDIIDKNNRIKYLGILGYDDVLKFEQNSITLYSKAKDKARQLLKENKQKDAIKLLNFTAKKIWNEAAKVLKIRYN